MDAWRLGRVVWSLRHRLGWQQGDLAKRARTSQSAISRIERGHGDRIPLRALRAVLEQLDAEVGYEVRWRAGALDRLLDERHARLVGLATQLLVGAGWEVIPELTYSTYGERGSIDLLGWSATSRHLIVVEVKTELVSVEATLRKLDEKVRLAPAVARERLGWHVQHVSRLLILPGDNTSRRRILRHAVVLDRALPDRSRGVRAWLRQPGRSIAGILFMGEP